MRPQVARRAFTVDEYHRMAEAGILSPDDRVELIDGEIVRMCPIGSPHAACVDRLTALLTAKLRRRAIVRVQSPIVLSRRSEPQPDVVVLRPREDFYAARHPRPAEVLLAIEVVDADAAYVRGTKLAVYSRAGIVEVWVVDLRRRVVEVYRGPTLRAYRERLERAPGRRLTAAGVPRLTVRVADVLG